jgi:hypothetical protein
MNVMFQPKDGSGHLASKKTRPAAPPSTIRVAYFSHSPFEPQIKNRMNSNSTDPLDSLVSAPCPTSAARAKTLTEPRFPEALTDWLAPSNRLNDALEREQQERNLFEASLRAVTQASSPAPDLKLVEFSVELPDARVVQLAADFTDWEDAPLNMIRFEGGIWCISVPLPPGIYAYRFLADGEWFDDPRVAQNGGDTGAPRAFVKVR